MCIRDRYIEKDAALERRFQPVMVEEPTVEDTISILRGLKDRYGSQHLEAGAHDIGGVASGDAVIYNIGHQVRQRQVA